MFGGSVIITNAHFIHTYCSYYFIDNQILKSFINNYTIWCKYNKFISFIL